MKKGTIILIMLFIFCSGVMAQSAGQSKYLRPTNFQEKVSIKVSGKSRTYYALSPEKGAIINIQGPGKLRVLTRAQFKSSTAKEMAYEIQYTIDGAEQHIIELDNAGPSTIADYNDATIGTPGELKDFEIVLRRGYHNIEFILMEDKIPVAARYNFMPTKEKKQEWIAFCPLKPSEPVDLVSRESTVNYYRFSK